MEALEKKNSKPSGGGRQGQLRGGGDHPQATDSFVTATLAALYALLFGSLRRTWRQEKTGLETIDEALDRKQRVLAVFWHGVYPALFPLLEGYDACFLTSCSFRGRIIAHMGRRFGFHAIYTSVHHAGGLHQALELELRAHRCLAVAVDGPHGPYHHIRESLILLADRLDLTIVPLSIAIQPSIILRHRWDNLTIPLPFSRVKLHVGRPFPLPRRVSADEAGRCATELRLMMESNDQLTVFQRA